MDGWNCAALLRTRETNSSVFKKKTEASIKRDTIDAASLD